MPGGSRHGAVGTARGRRVVWRPHQVPASAVCRAVRAAVVAPAVFAVGEQLLHQRQRGAVRGVRPLREAGGPAGVTGVKLIWTLDHLQALQRMQGEVLPAARLAAAVNGTPLAWLHAGRHRPARCHGLAREALNG